MGFDWEPGILEGNCLAAIASTISAKGGKEH